MYIVLCGTTVKVKKPDDETVEHVMRRVVAIPGGKAKLIGYDLHYRHGDHTIIVRADQAVYGNSQCPQCKWSL